MTVYRKGRKQILIINRSYVEEHLGIWRVTRGKGNTIFLATAIVKLIPALDEIIPNGAEKW